MAEHETATPLPRQITQTDAALKSGRRRRLGRSPPSMITRAGLERQRRQMPERGNRRRSSRPGAAAEARARAAKAGRWAGEPRCAHWPRAARLCGTSEGARAPGRGDAVRNGAAGRPNEAQQRQQRHASSPRYCREGPRMAMSASSARAVFSAYAHQPRPPTCGPPAKPARDRRQQERQGLRGPAERRFAPAARARASARRTMGCGGQGRSARPTGLREGLDHAQGG